MEWTESIRRTIQYLENHLLVNEEELNLSKEIGVSGYYLQKGFRRNLIVYRYFNLSKLKSK